MMDSGPDGTLSFEQFRAHVAEQLDDDLSGQPPEARLGDDLELDSIQRLEALVGVEELGVHLPDDSVGAEQTLGGLHALYTAARQPGMPGQEARPAGRGAPDPGPATSTAARSDSRSEPIVASTALGS